MVFLKLKKSKKKTGSKLMASFFHVRTFIGGSNWVYSCFFSGTDPYHAQVKVVQQQKRFVTAFKLNFDQKRLKVLESKRLETSKLRNFSKL